MNIDKARITRNRIEQLTVGEKIWDTEIIGLYVFRQKTKTCFYYKYRVGKKQKLSNLGQVGSISIEAVKSKARQYYILSRDGIDPVVYFEQQATQAEKEYCKNNYTIADAYSDWEQYIKPQLKSSSLAEWTYYNKYVAPRFASSRLIDIKPEEMNSFHASIEKPYAANRSIKILKKLYHVAITLNKYEGKLPFTALKLHTERSRRRHLTGDEPRRLYLALEQYKTKGREEYKAYVCVMLYLLTSARKSEWLGTPKEWVDLRSGLLHLPNTKNDEPDSKILPRAAVGLLKSLFEQYPESPWVFPSPKNKSRPLENIKRHWKAIREIAGIENLRLHDLRRSFASIALTSGYNLHQIGEILNHKNVNTTKGYAYLLDQEKRTATENIAGNILDRMKRKTLKEVYEKYK